MNYDLKVIHKVIYVSIKYANTNYFRLQFSKILKITFKQVDPSAVLTVMYENRLCRYNSIPLEFHVRSIKILSF